MAGDSILSYGGVQLPFVKTEKFVEETQYSPDGVDSIFTKTTIGVGCVLSECLLGEDVPTWHRRVRPTLMQRGHQLYFIIDGEQVYDYTANPPASNPLTVAGEELTAAPDYYHDESGVPTEEWGTDAMLGPKPKRFEIRQLQGDTWIAYYEIETYIPYCAEDSTPAMFLSNRWEIDLSIDQNYFKTRTINGTLVLNGQYQGYNDQVYTEYAIWEMMDNQIVIPSLPNRWKRETIRLARSSDGLRVNYVIVDKQQYSAMPRPATEIEATYTETSGTPGLATMNIVATEMQILIKGEPNESYDPTDEDAPDQNKYDLMKLMFQLAFTRIKFPFTLPDTDETWEEQEMITYFQLKEDLFRPIVGCTIRSLRNRKLTSHPIGKNQDWQSDVWALTNVGQPLKIADIQDDIARQPTNIGSYGLYLVAAAAIKDNPLGSGTVPLDNCGLTNERAINLDFTDEGYYGNTEIYSTILTTGSTDLASGYYDVHTDNYDGQLAYEHPFTDYDIDVAYITNNHAMQLPIMYDVASTEASCVYATTAAPTTKKVITWTASRLSKWPVIPNPENAQEMTASPDNDKLLNYTISFKHAELLEDGLTRKYSVGGVYEVATEKRMQWDVEDGKIYTSVNPRTNDYWDTSVNAYLTANILTGIVGYGTEAPGGSTD